MKKQIESIFVVLVMFSFLILPGCMVEEQGKLHTGKLLSFEKKGGMVDNWEGELILHGITVNNDGIFLNKFKFSTTDMAVAEKINKSKECWASVELTYNKERFQLPWDGDQPYVATDIKCLSVLNSLNNIFKSNDTK